MSFFDPYHVSEYTGYYSKKGQVIQKRHVERNPALSLKDKEKAIKILNSFGYKAIPNDYMPLEEYNYFSGRTLSYKEFGHIDSGGSYKVKLRNLLSFLPDLPIFNQVSYNNVEEFNISCILTGFTITFNADSISSNGRIYFGEGTRRFYTNINPPSGQKTGFIVSPYIDNGYVISSVSSATSSSYGYYNIFPASAAIKGQLTENTITGDKYLFNSILNRDFSDQRFDSSIFEIYNNTQNPNDYMDVDIIGAYFSVEVQVIYKTYLD